MRAHDTAELHGDKHRLIHGAVYRDCRVGDARRSNRGRSILRKDALALSREFQALECRFIADYVFAG